MKAKIAVGTSNYSSFFTPINVGFFYITAQLAGANRIFIYLYIYNQCLNLRGIKIACTLHYGIILFPISALGKNMKNALLNVGRVLRLVPFACFLSVATQQAAALPTWSNLGTASNSTDPSVWESKSFNVTTLVTGAVSATLFFDLRNDWNSPGLTTSNVEFGIDGTDYFARFTYVTGDDTSHWRNVLLDIDGLLYVDQYGTNNNHLGDALLGTAQQGGSGDPAIYVLQEQDTQGVPEPASLALLGLGLAGLGLSRHRKA